jgi:hypothetical protein
MLVAVSLLQEILPLEEALLRLGPACDRACLESLLAIDFREFGASGRVWTRELILAELDGHPERIFAIEEALCQQVAEDAALLTYRVSLGGRVSLRSSLWVRRDGRWQLLFHQGTVA